MEKVCKSCGKQLEDGQNFCPNCGARMEEPMQEAESLCKTCGAKLPPDQLFCTACGAKIEDAPREEVQEDAEVDKASEKLHKGRKKLMYWLIGSIIVVIAIIAIIVGINESDSSSSSGSYSGSYGSSNSTYEPILVYGVTVEHTQYNTIIKGTVINKGHKTYTYVRVGGDFGSFNAVGAEGIAPGESRGFYIPIPKNTSISAGKHSATVINYQEGSGGKYS